jgi:dihydroxyacid dehydratase/phosphogluconate dehydratase
MEDVHKIGGIPAILKYLLNHTDLVDGTQLTVTGKTMAQNLEDVSELEFHNQDVIRKLDDPFKKTGHLTILRGSLAPGTAVAKLTGKEGLRFEVGGLTTYNHLVSHVVLLFDRELQNVLIGSLMALFLSANCPRKCLVF